jgi:hypothetical protein
MSLAEGWGVQIARRVPAAMPPEAADPLGKKKARTQWRRRGQPLHARGAKESLHEVENRTSPSHPRHRRIGSPHPSPWRDHSSRSVAKREGGGEIRPAGGMSHCAEACGSRAGVSRWGIGGVAFHEQRGAPLRDVPARSHAEAGRRAALDAQPERPLKARGAKESLHEVENRTSPSHPRGKTTASRSAKKKGSSWKRVGEFAWLVSVRG